MSYELLENDFKNIFDAIKDVSHFLNLAATETLEADGVEKLLFASHYIEKIIAGIKKCNLASVFENKLNDYLKRAGKLFFINSQQLEKCCDEVMNKIFTLQPSCEVLSIAIDEYVRLTSYERFEELVNRLAEFRSVFIKLTHATKHVFTSAEVQSCFLVRSWLKVLDSSENGEKEIESIMQLMLQDVNSIDSIVAILNMEKTDHNFLVQNILLKVISSEARSSSFSASWKAFLLSKNLVNTVLNQPVLLDSILSSLESVESRYEFDLKNKVWSARSSCDIDYITLFKILREFYRHDDFHYKIKRFIRIRKVKSTTEFWDYFGK